MNSIWLIISDSSITYGHGSYGTVPVLATDAPYGGKPFPAFSSREEAVQFINTLSPATQIGLDAIEIMVSFNPKDGKAPEITLVGWTQKQIAQARAVHNAFSGEFLSPDINGLLKLRDWWRRIGLQEPVEELSIVTPDNEWAAKVIRSAISGMT